MKLAEESSGKAKQATTAKRFLKKENEMRVGVRVLDTSVHSNMLINTLLHFMRCLTGQKWNDLACEHHFCPCLSLSNFSKFDDVFRTIHISFLNDIIKA